MPRLKKPKHCDSKDEAAIFSASNCTLSTEHNRLTVIYDLICACITCSAPSSKVIEPSDQRSSSLHQRIIDVFNEYGVAIRSPHFTQGRHPAPAAKP